MDRLPARPLDRVRQEIRTVPELFALFSARNRPSRSKAGEHERARNRAEFSTYAADVPIGELIPDDLEAWIEGHEGWESGWTRLRISNTIKRPFNWAVRKGLIGRNPFASCSYAKGKRGLPIDRQTFNRLLGAAHADTRRILFFMSVCGIRPGELCDLEWAWLDLRNGTATIRIHKTSDSRADHAPRVVILPDVAVRLLVWIKKRAVDDERYVFPNRRGEKLERGALDLRVYRLRERLDIPKSVKLYGVRHAWATDLAIGGVDLAPLAELLGHTTLEMAKYYLHLAGRSGYLKGELERGLKGSRKS